MSGQTTIIPAGTLFKFEGLELQEAQYLIGILGEKPLNQVHGLWSKLNGQLAMQTTPKPPTPVAPPETPAPADVSAKTPVAPPETPAPADVSAKTPVADALS